NNACVDTSSNPANCGTCFNACPTGQLCSGGACVGCDATHPCQPGQCCDNGSCTTFCSGGQVRSGRACLPFGVTHPCGAGHCCDTATGTCVTTCVGGCCENGACKATCSSGCCDKNATPPTCVAGTANTACGSLGDCDNCESAASKGPFCLKINNTQTCGCNAN